ncbi:MAG: 4Fe-4S ferredoxin [Chloroflexi bacterium]|nr:4Fe-4S ferredoxin [Chloroflexota bacterium]
MAYKIITGKCTTVPWHCGDCRPGCPNKAISTAHAIDPGRCTECVGAYDKPQCAQVCPAGACVPDPAHRETRAQLLRKWRKLHPGEKPAPGTY